MDIKKIREDIFDSVEDCAAVFIDDSDDRDSIFAPVREGLDEIESKVNEALNLLKKITSYEDLGKVEDCASILQDIADGLY